MAKRQVEEKAESLKKKKRGYQESYIEFGFITLQAEATPDN